jgi:hypothetical protein
MKQDYLADFHCHASLRAINTPPVKEVQNVWEKTYNGKTGSSVSRWARIHTQEISKESQTAFYDFAAGNTRVVVDSLYPIEKHWYKFRKMPSYIVGQKAREEIIQAVFGIERKRLHQLTGASSYFDELREAYYFLLNGQGNSPDGRFKYKLVNNFGSLQHIIENEPDTMAVLLSVEGAHSLDAGCPCSDRLSDKQLKQLLSNNINEMKSWEFTPLYMNLAHHYWNRLCGHARSIKPPLHLIFNQEQGLDLPIQDLGWSVIEELLSQKNGSRIFVDVKHMSALGRKEYYEYINKHNRQYPEDKIPVICSHTAVSGYNTMLDLMRVPDNKRKFKGSYFNNWSINLCDEDIYNICESGGVIGIMMDKGLLCSPDKVKQIRTISDVEKKKESFIKVILDNLFGIIRAVRKKETWDRIVIGSDYDGMITHFDCYENASRLPEVKNDLISYLKKYGYHEELWYGYSPEELMQKIFTGNVMMFLEKYFYRNSDLKPLNRAI